MPALTDKAEALKLIKRRHPEYLEVVQTSRWLLDTLEAGDRYRDASYGLDPRSSRPIRNLIRHKREYAPVRTSRLVDEHGFPFEFTAPEERDYVEVIEADYELRRQRTPVPNFLAEFIGKQLSKIYKRPVARQGPGPLLAWLEDIDGRQTSLQEWMRETIGPLLCALGMIDVQLGHPERPEDEPSIFGDDLSDPQARCVVNYILPENVLWWKHDYRKQYYLELLVLEKYWNEQNKLIEEYRHWTYEDWSLYAADGTLKGTALHNFGVVPIVRLFDRRNLRCDNVASSRMWGIADKSRAYYNEESELVANNTLHNCPILQGPGDDGTPGAGDQSVPIGRGFLLKRVVDRNGNHVGFDYLGPPVATSEFMRLRLQDIQERMEREVALTRSLGSVGVGGKGAVAQSGISKAYDQQEGSEYLAGISMTLESAEYTICYFATVVLHDGFAGVPRGDWDSLQITYPKEFNLLSFDQFAAIAAAYQAFCAGGVGALPTMDKLVLRQFAQQMIPDASREDLASIDGDIDAYVTEQVRLRQLPAPAPPALAAPAAPPQEPVANRPKPPAADVVTVSTPDALAFNMDATP